MATTYGFDDAANGTDLEDTPAGWVDEIHGGNDIELQSGVGVGTAGYDSGEYVYVHPADVPDDGYVQVDVVGGDNSTNNRFGTVCRFTKDGSKDGYYWYTRLAAGACELGSVDNGAFTYHDENGASHSSASCTLKMTFSGTTIKAFVDDNEELSMVDGDYGSGYCGLHQTNTFENPTEVDDYEASDVPAGGGGESVKPKSIIIISKLLANPLPIFFGGFAHKLIKKPQWTRRNFIKHLLRLFY